MRLLVDATTLLTWLDRPPVGTVRIERLVVADLCRRLSEAELGFVKVRHGAFVPVTAGQREAIRRLADGPAATQAMGRGERRPGVVRGVRRRVRRWLETGRSAPARGEQEIAAFAGATDFLTLGHGWDYLDHGRLDSLRGRHGFRVHAFVHDLIAVEYPHFFHDPKHADRLRRHHTALCGMAETLIVNSQATRRALERFIAQNGLRQPRLHMAPLPTFVTPAARLAANLPPELGDEPFVLYVSTLEVRKNHRLLLRLWSEAVRMGRPLPRLVLVGRIGWGVEEALLMLRHDPALRGRVLLLEDVHDDTLAALYRHCLFTVYPSYAEGWGMPIAEAMAFSKICVHADDPAQAEAAQGLMPALHPDDYVGWRKEISGLARDQERRDELGRSIASRWRLRAESEFGEEIWCALEAADCKSQSGQDRPLRA